MITRRDWLALSGGLMSGLSLTPALGGTAADTADQPIGEAIEPIRKQHNLPALAGALVTRDGPTRVGAVGHRRQDDGPKVTADDKFHLGSCTKAMTATLLATFVEDGSLAWETTLADALPDLARSMRAEYRGVTVEQLLAQVSGFSEATEAPGFDLGSMRKITGPLPKARHAYAAKVLAEPPANPPGSKFVYSNRNYVVAGVIAERLGKDSWEALIRRRLFEPLGMATAGFGPMAKPGEVDQPWPHLSNGGRRVALTAGPAADNPALIGPAGTVHCSLGDWGKFAACHLNGGRGETPLLKPETFARMQAPPKVGSYAFGWGFAERDWGGGTVLTHAGSNTLNYAVIWLAPRRGLALLSATNQGNDAAAKACDAVAVALLGLKG